MKPCVSPRILNTQDVQPLVRPRTVSEHDIKPSFTRLPLAALVAVTESLVARNSTKTLTKLNVTSKAVNRDTLPVLRRTMIFPERGGGKKETQKQKAERWKAMMVNARASRYIKSVILLLGSLIEGIPNTGSASDRFVVDRDIFYPTRQEDFQRSSRPRPRLKPIP